VLNPIITAIAEEASPGSNRWYLKDNEAEKIDKSEIQKEDQAASILEVFMNKQIKERPYLLGVTFAELYEHFLYAVDNKNKPRRPPQEWIRDYFYLNEDGTYRPPRNEEEREAKKQGRIKGLSYKIKRYLSALEQDIPIPIHLRPNDRTLAEWLRHCKRSGLYEQGKLIYEKGGLNLDNLPEEVMVNIEEDYQVCVRMLERASTSSVKKKARRGKKKMN